MPAFLCLWFDEYKKGDPVQLRSYRLLNCWREIIGSMQTFAPALREFVKELRSQSVYSIVGVMFFVSFFAESGIVRSYRLLNCWREIIRSMQTFAPALREFVKELRSQSVYWVVGVMCLFLYQQSRDSEKLSAFQLLARDYQKYADIRVSFEEIHKRNMNQSTASYIEALLESNL